MMKVILSNCSPGESASLARSLVQEGYAACVNIIPGVRSVFRWEGKLCEEEEHTLLIKTTPERCEALESRLKELHSYSVPEIIVLDAAHVLENYLDWVRECVTE